MVVTFKNIAGNGNSLHVSGIYYHDRLGLKWLEYDKYEPMLGIILNNVIPRQHKKQFEYYCYIIDK